MRRAVMFLDLLAAASLSTFAQFALFGASLVPEVALDDLLVGVALFLAVAQGFILCAIALSGVRRSAWLLQGTLLCVVLWLLWLATWTG